MSRHGSPGVWDEQVALTPTRLDALGRLAVVPEFAPQVANADVQHAIDAVVRAPVELLK
jgi:hypothetical protein